MEDLKTHYLGLSGSFHSPFNDLLCNVGTVLGDWEFSQGGQSCCADSVSGEGKVVNEVQCPRGGPSGGLPRRGGQTKGAVGRVQEGMTRGHRKDSHVSFPY